MAVIVEDGTGSNPNANSYVDEAYASAFADLRGLTLPSDSNLISPLLVRATDYLNSLGARYSGTRTILTGKMQWPRMGAYADCEGLASDEVPWQIEDATVQLAVAFHAGLDFASGSVGSAGGEIIKEEIGPLKITYAEGVSASGPNLSIVESLIKPLFRSGGSGGGLVSFLRV